MSSSITDSSLNDASSQLDHQHQLLSSRLGRAADQLHYAQKRWNYRARISMRPNSLGELGYHQPRSHDHVPIANCPLAHPLINKSLATLPPTPFPLHSVEFRTDGDRVVLHIVERRKRSKAVLIEWAKNHVDAIALNGKTIFGNGLLHISAGGIEHMVSPSSFYQINLEMNQHMVHRVKELLEPLQPERILDLYSGFGNLSLPFAQKGIPVELIESNSSSLKDAKNTIKRLNLPATLTLQDANKFQAGQSIFDVALLDPPRSGAQKTLEQVSLTRPKAILYISCNPQGFIHEQKKLSGYQLARWELFEMFPQTTHVESLALYLRQ